MDMAPIATESDAEAEGVHELGVAAAAGRILEPLSKAVDLAFEVEHFADERSQRERDDDERGAAGRDLAAGYGEHAAHGAGDADEDDGHSGCLEQGVLNALADESSKGESGKAAQEDERDVDERSESDHGGS